jgi:adenylosuccinate synthase
LRNNLAVIGAQWGDEGKAKIVDALAGSAKIVARYQGGANAGHTVVTDRGKFVFHLIPAGILHPHVECVIGNGVAFDPEAFVRELDELDAAGVATAGRLHVSGRAHVVMPYHKALDALSESRTGEAIGTTMRGIGPCYRTKAERKGILVADLLAPDRVRKRLAGILDWLLPNVPESEQARFALEPMLDFLERHRERVSPFVSDTSARLLDHLDRGEGGVLFEGAQGTMLDLDHGTYPYVTSSSTIAGGIPPGLGLPPASVNRILGISKGYTTRVGEGAFPTEDHGTLGAEIRRIGQEFGATTGRPRRCGWLDLVALRYAVRLSGIHSLAITKLDVLDGFHTVRVCVAYQFAGRQITQPPLHPEDLQACEPVYREFRGWKEPLAGCIDPSTVPERARDLLAYVSSSVGVPVAMLSTGPARGQMVSYRDPWA